MGAQAGCGFPVAKWLALFDLTTGRTPVANISLIEWNRNLDKVKGDRNSNPYGVLALADRQIVTDAGANAVLQVQGSKISVLAVLPKNGKGQSVPTSVANRRTRRPSARRMMRLPSGKMMWSTCGLMFSHLYCRSEAMSISLSKWPMLQTMAWSFIRRMWSWVMTW